MSDLELRVLAQFLEVRWSFFRHSFFPLFLAELLGVDGVKLSLAKPV